MSKDVIARLDRLIKELEHFIYDEECQTPEFNSALTKAVTQLENKRCAIPDEVDTA